MSSGTPASINVHEETVDSLRIHVRRTLDMLRVGDLYTKYGLTELDELRLVPDDIETGAVYEDVVPRDRGHIFQVFLHAVASEIVESHGMKGDKKKKRAIKEYREVLQQHRGEWIENIFIQKQKRNIAVGSSAIRVTRPPPAMPAMASPTPATPIGDNDIGTIPKKKKKKGTATADSKKAASSSTAKKRKRSDADESQHPDDDHQRPSTESTPKKSSSKKQQRKKEGKQQAASAKQRFEAERDAILADMPDDYKTHFQQLGFGQWGKNWLPVLVVSPYSVPPGDIRDLWLKMYGNVKEKNQMDKLSYLVHWLGAGGYSLVPGKKFMPYETALKQGHAKIPKKLQESNESGKKLPKQQQERLDGLLVLREQIELKPEERTHPMMEFFELHELELGDEVLSDVREEELDDDIESEEDELLDDDDDELVDDDPDDDPELDSLPSPSPIKKKRKYTKKAKKAKVAEVDLDDFAERESDEEMEEPAPKKPPKEKRKPGRPPKKQKIVIEEVESAMDMDEPAPTVQATADQEKIPKVKKESTVAKEPVVPMQDEAKVPKKAKKEQVENRVVTAELLDEIIGASASASDDSDDSEFGGDEYGKKYFEQELYAKDNFDEDLDVKPKKKGRLHKKGSKKMEKDRDEDEKVPPKKKVTRERKKRSKAAEQRDLEKCEGEYLPLIEKLKSASQKKNLKKIQSALKAILPVAESFSAPFFQIYEIPAVMKSTKSVLAETGDKDDMATYKALWNTMKVSYKEKEANIPEGFKAKKGRGIIKVEEPPSNPERPTFAPAKVKSEDQGAAAAPTAEAASTANTAEVKKEIADAGATSATITKEPRDAATVPESPMKVPMKVEKRRPSLDEEQKQMLQINKTAEKAAPPKPKPKKFSVMDLMGSKKKAQRDETGGTGASRTSLSAHNQVGKKTIPAWLTTSPPPSKSDATADTSDRRDDRLFALEFLLQAASHLPDGKGVSVEAVSRSLELAIYEWSETSANWANDYWGKVHAIVAAITGKNDIGTLVEMLVDGDFSTPKSVVNLSLEHLEDSFEGRPVLYQE